MAGIITNVYLWISLFFLMVLMFIFLLIFVILLAKKTHAMIEFKSWMKGIPIALFFQENRYCEWKPVVPDAGIVIDKNYGAFIINEKATYIDKKTKNVLIPFDAQFGASINVHAAKLSDDLQYIMQDEEEMKKFRWAMSRNLIADNDSVEVLKTSINFGAIKSMTSALIPHNINAKIEKVIASRMHGMGVVNVPQVVLIFAGILGAIICGYILLKATSGGGVP